MPPFLFYLCGMLPWSYFSSVLSGTGNTFQANAAVFTKVYFPRLIVPLATVISSVFALVVQAATFGVVYAVIFSHRAAGAGWSPEWGMILLVPFLIVQTALLALGLGLLASALSAKYRDLQHALPFVVQLGLFATPVIYSTGDVPERWRPVLALNPMTGVIEAFRWALLGTGDLPLAGLSVSTAMVLLLLATGLLYFRRMERTFADVI